MPEQTDRTDHARMARWFLNDIPDDADDRTTRSYCAEAQVHATLALAEQQRIGNLIAIMASAAVGVANRTTAREDYIALYRQINPQILEALGLQGAGEPEPAWQPLSCIVCGEHLGQVVAGQAIPKLDEHYRAAGHLPDHEVEVAHRAPAR